MVEVSGEIVEHFQCFTSSVCAYFDCLDTVIQVCTGVSRSVINHLEKL